MSCERFETDLALYSEGDLPVTQVPSIEEHLATCATCQSFLVELRVSQSMLRSLAADPVPEESLLSARRRILTRVSRRRPVFQRWAWAAAASLAVVALGLTASRIGRDRHRVAAPESPTPALAAVPPSAPPASRFVPAGPPRLVRGLKATSPQLASSLRSTVPNPSTVSPGMDPDGLFTAAPLSKEDADQLARAVVAIAAVERLPHVSEDDDRPVLASRLIQIGTSDPNVVIYWELAPTGGES